MNNTERAKKTVGEPEGLTLAPESARKKALEILFYGDYTWVLENNLKLITFRKPNQKYNFAPGTVVNAKSTDTGEVVPLRVLGVNVRPLDDYSDIHLLLDGFLNSGAAVATLSEFYDNVDYDAPMMAIYTISDALFQSLSPELQESMLANGFDSLDDVDQPDAAITWPALCFWLLDQLSEDEEDEAWQVWIDYLVEKDLIGRGDGEARLNSGENKPKDELLDIAMGDKNSPEFKKYILLEE